MKSTSKEEGLEAIGHIQARQEWAPGMRGMAKEAKGGAWGSGLGTLVFFP